MSRHTCLLSFIAVFLTLSAYAQPGFKVDIDKPAPYQERKLKSEKTGDGKLKGPKRILQNLTTRFNYFFNANNKLAEVIGRAKEGHKDDYAELLSFYNYDLSATAADSAQLDSVIYKSRTGLANHDLRNEWTDELYLLWASAWHLQKKFDSASMMLQFINYAYAPKFEDGYFKPIGTNITGAKELSIATKEEKKFLHNNNFSRNQSFLWQVRTLIEMDDMTGAGSLITTLKRDPVFPKKYQNTLDEIEAYWWYRQQRWDSAAAHLSAALDGDYPKLEKARWRYLIAQMLERCGKTAEAAGMYQKVVEGTPDPVMEVYARLKTVRLSKVGGEDATDKNLAELLKMARRDKYEDYRDIIYYMAAQMELERGNIAAANDLLLKGAKYSTGDQSAKSRAFLKIADVSYLQKKYGQAAQFYDSIQVSDLAEADAARVAQRKPALQKVVQASDIVARQDSLQRLAALPEEDRKDAIKAVLKKLRKQQGLKEDVTLSAGGSNMPMAGGSSPNAPPADLFSQQKGEWYFYNTNARAQGQTQFKSLWGNRPNSDNWRRFAVVSQQQQALASPDQPLDVKNPNAPKSDAEMSAGMDLSVEGLTSRLPLTPEALKASNDSIQRALFGLATAYLNDIEDLPSAIATFEELRRRFPENEKNDEALFNLFYAYGKTGNTAAAAAAKRTLTEKYPASRFTAIVSTGKDPVAKSNAPTQESTKAYENVYNQFIEGRFSDAIEAKRIADSTYKTTFWQPQLLYIESVYHIKQRQDSAAKNVLQTIIRQNTNQALTAKAQNLLNVLDRRKQIEEELASLQITRPSDDDSAAARPVAAVAPPAKDTAVVKRPDLPTAADSAALAKARQKQVADSLAQVAAVATAKRDSMALAKQNAKRIADSVAAAKRDSLALAKTAKDQAKKDSIANAALRLKQRQDSIALAKATRDQARKDSLATAQLQEKQQQDSIAFAKQLAQRVTDSLALVQRDALAKTAQAAQRRKDSLAQVREALAQARKDSLALRAALAKQASDSAALRKYFEQRQRDSLARATRDAIALARRQAQEARADSLARKAMVDKQRKDSIALAKTAKDQARRDSLSLAQTLQKQRLDSMALARQTAKRMTDSLAAAKRDSLALAKSAKDQARKDSLAAAAVRLKERQDSIALAKTNRDQARRDSIAGAQLRKTQQRDSIAFARQLARRFADSLETVRRDSLALARRSYVDPNAYHYEPAKPHYGVVILDKVDPIFVSEARNAFFRYNREQNFDNPLDVQIVNITADVRLLVISGLPNAAAATDYISKAKTLAPTEIIPWLTGNKYTFSIISARNLELLKTKTEVPDYKAFLEQHLPGKF